MNLTGLYARGFNAFTKMLLTGTPAPGGGGLLGKEDINPSDAYGLVSTIIGAVLWIPAGLGVFYLFSGLIKFFQAFNAGNNPEAMAGAGREILTGVGLIALKVTWSILSPIIFG